MNVNGWRCSILSNIENTTSVVSTRVTNMAPKAMVGRLKVSARWGGGGWWWAGTDGRK